MSMSICMLLRTASLFRRMRNETKKIEYNRCCVSISFRYGNLTNSVVLRSNNISCRCVGVFSTVIVPCRMRYGPFVHLDGRAEKDEQEEGWQYEHCRSQRHANGLSLTRPCTVAPTRLGQVQLEGLRQHRLPGVTQGMIGFLVSLMIAKPRSLNWSPERVRPVGFRRVFSWNG